MNCPSAWVGALAGRGDAISNEWKLETRAKLEAGDLKITAIIKVRRYYVDTGDHWISRCLLCSGHRHLQAAQRLA